MLTIKKKHQPGINLSILCCCFLLLALQWPCTLFAANEKAPVIITLPQAQIEETLQQTLPLKHKLTSEKLQGTVTVTDIETLQISDTGISCTVNVLGERLQIITKLGDQSFRFNLGALQVSFPLEAVLRFDRAKQRLSLIPTMTENKSTTNDNQALLIQALLEGRKFTLDLKDLDPISFNIGDKSLLATSTIQDVRTEQEQIRVLIKPQIASK